MYNEQDRVKNEQVVLIKIQNKCTKPFLYKTIIKELENKKYTSHIKSYLYF